jgi:hypothetical protein
MLRQSFSLKAYKKKDDGNYANSYLEIKSQRSSQDFVSISSIILVTFLPIIFRKLIFIFTKL